MVDLAVINAGELVTCAGAGTTAEERLGIIEGGALLADAGKVTWVGTTREFERKSVGRVAHTIDAGGGLVTPGFVDPHTHVIFSGSREEELEKKSQGASYADILASGGGIAKTMRDTRKASVEQIVRESGERLTNLVKNGVTTVEVKTGYGQSVEGELKMLGAMEELRGTSGAELVATFLGLHAKPPEFRSAAEYTDFAIRELLPAIAAARPAPVFSDCFCEEGVFSQDQCRRFLEASWRLGFALKIHADEFADSGGAALAGELRCVSADHLVMSDQEGIGGMSRGGTVAVLLPGTSLFSHIPYADARAILASGCRVALGTDLSPNSWVESPQLVMGLACTGLRMTPAEALLGFTRSAAAAISRSDIGSLVPGSQCDFAVHSIPGYRFVPYRVGGAYVKGVYKRGKRLWGRA